MHAASPHECSRWWAPPGSSQLIRAVPAAGHQKTSLVYAHPDDCLEPFGPKTEKVWRFRAPRCAPRAVRYLLRSALARFRLRDQHFAAGAAAFRRADDALRL